ncbi:hypothetical protein CONPUDRAFT_39102, partial [Coniophora puteana RWD-64-598 SS2]
RTLWDIVSPCLLTIFACIYTSVHPNIPSPYDGPLRRLFRSAKIMSVAVIAPELLVAWATRQFISSRNLTRHETWGMTHSFFAYMGGFMVYHDGKPWRTITPARLILAIQEGHIAPIRLTEAEIEDASKGDVLSKGLVVLQVSWFGVQLIARYVYHLTVTPLEISTVAFALLVFFTYGLWWKKPLNVGCPRRLEWK